MIYPGFGVPGQLLTILSVKDVLWSAYPLSAKYETEDCAFLGVDYLQLVFLEDDHVNYLGVVSLCIVVLVCWSPCLIEGYLTDVENKWSTAKDPENVHC
ncbi:hypothetical protein AAC387_Pa08g2117 [Persea americana]